jgi:hypothetical protein
MLRREFLQMLGLRPTLAAVNPNPQPESSFVSVQQFGAAGDGRSDDTAALQSAIDFALRVGKPCFLPSGVYRITAPLRVGQPSGRPNQQGFRLFGAGRAVAHSGGTGGTLILLSGSGHEAILKLENSMWRSATITDLGFQCQERSGATYGLMFYGTAFSGHTVRNVVVRNSSVGYGIVQSTGGNGEFTLYDNCFAFDVDKFFYSNAGQAYVQHFNHCVCTLNSGGIYFHLDLQSGGGGIDVFDFNATGASRPGGAPSDTTLFKNTASNSCLNFIGGRVEGLTQLYESRGGSPNLFVTAKFEGMQFSIDSKPGELGKRFVEVAVTPDVLTIQSCAFYGIRGNEAIEVQVRESYAYVIFQQCTFFELSKPPTVVAD